MKEKDPHRSILIKSVLLIAVLTAGIVLLYVHSLTPQTNKNHSIGAASSQEETFPFVEVTVSGNTYRYEGSEVSLDTLRESLKALDTQIVVHILDDAASEGSIQTLTEVLREAGRGYSVDTSVDRIS